LRIYQYFIVQIIIQLLCLYTKNELIIFFISILSFYIFVVFLYQIIKNNDDETSFLKEVLTNFYFREAVRVFVVYLIVFLVTYIPIIIFFLASKSDINNYFVVHKNILLQMVWLIQCVYLSFCSYAMFAKPKIKHVQVLIEGYNVMKNNIFVTLIITILFATILTIQILFVRQFKFISEIFIIIYIPISLSVLIIRKKMSKGHQATQ